MRYPQFICAKPIIIIPTMRQDGLQPRNPHKKTQSGNRHPKFVCTKQTIIVPPKSAWQDYRHGSRTNKPEAGCATRNLFAPSKAPSRQLSYRRNRQGEPTASDINKQAPCGGASFKRLCGQTEAKRGLKIFEERIVLLAQAPEIAAAKWQRPVAVGIALRAIGSISGGVGAPAAVICASFPFRRAAVCGRWG